MKTSSLWPHSLTLACSAGLMLHLIRQNGARVFVAALPVLEDGQKRAGKLGTAAQLLQISRQAQVHLSGLCSPAKHAISMLPIETGHWRSVPLAEPA